jgi:molybdenum cofactor guanylyltransferase
MVDVAQLVRALDCGSRGRRFKPGLPPHQKSQSERLAFFYDMGGYFSFFILFEFFD